ncbi:MAG: rod shape-determining protein MreC [Oscillibacter sp.]|nr:rod shape-determining protein MreC [Oscillibacter sp.]
MKNFLKRHGLWVLFAAAVIAVAMAVLSYFSNTSSPLANLTGVVASPFRTAYTAVSDWIGDKWAYYQDYQELKKENKALKKKIAEMESQVRQGQTASDENDRLHKLLNLQEKRPEFRYETAAVTERSSSNWTSSLTLNKGTSQDVKVNDCVITEEGYLVGIVTRVGLNWCTVLTVLDTDASLGAQVFRTSDIGVAQGDFNLMPQGKLKLSYLPAKSSLLNGDLVVTSGLGGYYPSGLVIGSVDAVQLDDAGATEYATLTPEADLANLSEVFIIKSFTAAG